MRKVLESCLRVLCGMGLASRAIAQEVIAPPPAAFSPRPPVVRFLPLAAQQNATQEQNAGSEEAPGVGNMLGAALAPAEIVMDWGRAHLRPHLFYSLSYGDGIQAQPGNQSKTVINQVAPGVSVDLGTHWHLDYTPTLRFYSSRALRDETDHSVNLGWGTAYQDWSFGFGQTYAVSSSPLVETGSQTDQESFGTALSLAYSLNSRMCVDSSVNQSLSFVGGNRSATSAQLSNSRAWSTTEGFNYLFWPGLSGGLSAGFGFDNVEVGPNMTHEQFQARLNWLPGRKLAFSFNGGLEDRQFLGSGRPATLNPIFGLSLAYQLFQATGITLTADRSVSSSYFQDQITESTGFSVSLHQRLLRRLYFDLTGGYARVAYSATVTGAAVNRRDDHTSLNARLSCSVLKRGTASIFYDWSENLSNDTGFKYVSNQTGLELGYRF